MRQDVPLKPGSLKDPELARLFCTRDPEERYCDLREVGSGSFGNVYYAHDKDDNDTVAVKKMNFSGRDSVEKWNDIVKEVRFLRYVAHPNIVQYRACYLKDQTCWLIMEYCIGSAADIISVFKEQLVEDAIGEICHQTLLGLAYIHKRHYIHRDVKAGNILITDAGVVKLADVGSASLRSPANSFVGSPYWIAPEVILAMDKGRYGTKADIWSLGITCIELANRKPPLYDLNTMSALYHIAQRNAPVLSRRHPQYPWIERSDAMINFVQECLIKDLDRRPYAEELKEHTFMERKRNPNLMKNLVRRTKKRVLELDNDAYTKMKKIFYLEGAPAPGTFGSDSSDDESECFIKLPDKAERTKETLNASTSRENNHEHLNGRGQEEEMDKEPSTTTLTNTSTIETSSSGDSNSLHTANGAASTEVINRPQDPDHVLRPAPIVHSRESSGESNGKKNRTVISISEPDEDTEITSGPMTGESSVRSNEIMQQQEINDEINTLKRSKFATLRPTKMITREMEEARRENNAKEQMSGYQRLRQHHHRELLQLEERCKFETEVMRQKQEKEYEQCAMTAQRELQKLRANNRAQLDKKSRENDEVLRKVRKHRTAANEHELKSFTVCQKREYKFNKEQAKRQLKERGVRKAAFEEAVKNVKSDLIRKWTAAETEFMAHQKERLATELLEMQRKCQSELQGMEHRLLANEYVVRARQLDAVEYMLMSHHNAAKDQALAHFNECAQMKKRHLQVQHESEFNNQTDYTKRQEDEMKRQHALKQKHLPRELKMKEALIKKQFRHTVKTQARQYKVLQAQLQQGVPKDEQKEISNRLKEEQTRKIASLAALYDNNIKKMMSEQTIKLESWQEEEMRDLNEKLSREMDVLLEFQTRQKNNLEEACLREYESLNATWTKKKVALQNKIDGDRVRFEQERASQLNALEMEQERKRLKLQTTNNGDRDRASSKGSAKRSDDLAIDSVPSTPNLQSDRLASMQNSHSASTSNRSSPSHLSTNL